MLNLAILLYLLALLAQIGATIVSFKAYKLVGKYQVGWIILALGLLLMAGRRITPLLLIYETSVYSLFDAFLAAAISLLIAIGIHVISKIITDWQYKSALLEKLLSLDFLTQVLSKSEIIKRGKIEVERSNRTGHPLAILELDIDHFKKVNDQFGHQAGDDVLKGLSSHCIRILREIDLFGRIGGEEFLAILPETNGPQALEVAERIRKGVENSTYKTTCNQHPKITVSIGIRIYSPRDEKSPRGNNDQILQMLINDADEAMYKAKAAGRNQIATH